MRRVVTFTQTYAGTVVAMTALLYAAGMSMLFVYRDLPRHRAEAAWFIAAGVTLAFAGITAKPTTDEDVRPANSLEELLILLTCIAAAATLYARTLFTGLLSDDFVLLARATSGSLTMGTEFFRPLPMAVWGAITHVAIDVGTTLHVVNVIVHAVNSWLVYLIANELRFSHFWSLAAAAIFITSPSSVEPVVWISGLFDLLMTAGTLAFGLGCLRARPVMAFAGLALALLSKETGVVGPAIGIGLALAARRPLRLPLIGLGATLAFVAVRLTALPPPDSYAVEPSRYVVKELISRALGALSLPWTALDMSARPVLVLFPWLALIILMATAIAHRVSRDRFAAILALLFWTLVSVVPVYRYFYVAPTLEGSRYLYLGTAGFALMFSALGSTVRTRRMLLVASAAAVVSIFTGGVGAVIHQTPWIHASRERDAILRAAQTTLARSACARISVAGLPDASSGAFVFRNGFREALTLSEIGTPPFDDTATCVYEWNGSAFVRASLLPRAQ